MPTAANTKARSSLGRRRSERNTSTSTGASSNCPSISPCASVLRLLPAQVQCRHQLAHRLADQLIQRGVRAAQAVGAGNETRYAMRARNIAANRGGHHVEPGAREFTSRAPFVGTAGHQYDATN